VGDLFADPDPFDTFDFQFGEIKIHIQGHKMENGQTLHSTGLTLWRASPLLCQYMVSQQDLIRERTVLEVGNTCIIFRV
jgi:predicted nicotinamide N-methyase